MKRLDGHWFGFGLGLVIAAFGLFLVSAGATKPFPGFGLFLAGFGVVSMTIMAAEAWRETRRREPHDDGLPH
ncbi:MAG: hypothetical protein L0Z62_47185 [Gemmataceae bacterium]|nr:hypothetical protein [Gemmataceae bacterium]